METVTVDIKSRRDGRVIFSAEVSVSIKECLRVRAALEIAVAKGASLDGASLVGARLDGASLVGARLVGARLDGASLVGARLDGASLVGARLDGASLVGASLVGASLVGAIVHGGAKLKGQRPIFQIGPIGSRCAYFVAYITDKGLRFDAGCQRQITREVFEERLQNEHDNNIHAKEYRAALAMIDAHAELWTPAEEVKK